MVPDPASPLPTGAERARADRWKPDSPFLETLVGRFGGVGLVSLKFVLDYSQSSFVKLQKGWTVVIGLERQDEVKVVDIRSSRTGMDMTSKTFQDRVGIMPI